METPEQFDIDLGNDHWLSYSGWSPDRELNPQYAELPDVEKTGAIIYHADKEGKPCASAIMFDLETVRRVFADKSIWRVEQWEPLTLSPSILCGHKNCGDHGFIREGKWVKA